MTIDAGFGQRAEGLAGPGVVVALGGLLERFGAFGKRGLMNEERSGQMCVQKMCVPVVGDLRKLWLLGDSLGELRDPSRSRDTRPTRASRPRLRCDDAFCS